VNLAGGTSNKPRVIFVLVRTHIRCVCRWHAELAVDRLGSTWFATFLSVVQSLTLVDYLVPPGNRDALDSELEVIGVSCSPFVIQADCCKRATLVPNGVDSGWANSAGRSELARSRKECGRGIPARVAKGTPWNAPASLDLAGKWEPNRD
jgi:hypothetical protein